MPDKQANTPLQAVAWPAPSQMRSVSGEKLTNPTKFTDRTRQDQLLEQARERFNVCVDAEEKIRQEALTDTEFSCGEQWDPVIKARREKGDTARPCLTINRIEEFVDHVVNNMRQNRPAIKIDPVGDGADQQDAEIRQGLIRHIEINSQSDIAKDTAMHSMCVGGLGWMRVVDDWESPRSFNQELYIRWVLDPFTVYHDPTAALPDWSDMQYLFVVEDYTIKDFKEQFGDDKEAASLTTYQSIGDHASSWFPSGKIRVAEYWYVTHEKDTLLALSDGRDVLLSEVETPLPPGVTILQQRECTLPQVNWALISAVDVLRQRKWKGSTIPFIPVIGKRTALDGEQILTGMVRYAREPQRLYNYIYSSFVEVMALAPKNSYIAEFSQIEAFRDMWERANTDPQAVLIYKQLVSEEGQQAPPPQRQSMEVDIASFVQALQVADQQLKAVFKIYDASLGQRGPQESGLAINARKIESDTGTYDWGDNFIRALEHLGRVLNELLPFYYNKPGRIVQILREDQSRDPVVMNQLHDGPDGKPRMVDLSKGRFSVVVSTGATYEDKRKESVDAMVSLFKEYPAGLSACADILVETMDFPGHEALAARLQKLLPPGLQPTDVQQQVPAQAQAQMQKMQEMIQQLTVALHQATDKSQLQLMKEEFENFRTQLSGEVQIAVAQIKAKSDEAKFLNDKLFSEAERIQGEISKYEGQPGSQQGSAPAGQPPNGSGSQQPIATPPSVLAGPQTASGQSVGPAS